MVWWLLASWAAPLDDCEQQVGTLGEVRLVCPTWQGAVTPSQPGSGAAILEFLESQLRAMSDGTEVKRLPGERPTVQFSTPTHVGMGTALVKGDTFRVALCQAEAPATCIAALDALVASPPAPSPPPTLDVASLGFPDHCEAVGSGRLSCKDALVAWVEHPPGLHIPTFEDTWKALVEGLSEQGTVSQGEPYACELKGQPARCQQMVLTAPDGRSSATWAGQSEALYAQCSAAAPLGAPPPATCRTLFSDPVGGGRRRPPGGG